METTKKQGCTKPHPITTHIQALFMKILPPGAEVEGMLTSHTEQKGKGGGRLHGGNSNKFASVLPMKKTILCLDLFRAYHVLLKPLNT